MSRCDSRHPLDDNMQCTGASGHEGNHHFGGIGWTAGGTGNYTPTLETVLAKLERPGAFFTADEVRIALAAREGQTP